MKKNIIKLMIHILNNKQMKIHFFCFFLVISLFTASVIKAQPSLLWQKTYGGSGHEYAHKTIPTSDGGFAFVGYSESTNGDVSGNHGGEDLWVAKTDASGAIQWSFLYGGTEDEEGFDLVQTYDGGFMVAGYSDSRDGDVVANHGAYGSDMWILKLTSAGALTWAKCFGGTDDEDATAIVKTQDGNFYVAGSTYSNDGDVSGNHSQYYSDFWVIKIDPAGTLLAQKCVGGTEYDEGINLALTSDNGCILAGRTASADGDVTLYHGGNDMLIAKLTSSFTVEWAKCFGGTETEECNAIVQLTDGSYTALGYSSTYNNGDVTGHHGAQGSDDFWLIHLTSTGSLSWARSIGGTGDDQANGLAATSDGGYMLTGLTNSTNGDVSGFHAGGFFDPDVWVCKVNSTGDVQWQRCCGGSGQDEAFNVFELSNGVFVVTAFTYSPDYDITNWLGDADGWIFKVSGATGIEEYDACMLLDVYPNPSKGNITIEISKSNFNTDNQIFIYNSVGRMIKQISSFENIINLNLTIFSKGIYFVRVVNNENTYTKKIVIE